VIDPYRKMRTAGSAEKSNRPIVYAWCVRVNINANRCKGSYRVPPAEQVESTLREWLKDNPNAEIEHVAQTPLADLDGRTYSLLMTIFYRD
jgi:hypothetical protein